MNIHVKDSMFRDPFSQSDRGGFERNAGKGDSPRNNSSSGFKNNFDEVQGVNSRDFTGFTRVRPGCWRKVYKSE